MDAEANWREYLDWMDSSYELYFQAQEAMGHSRGEAAARLSKIWEREDQERLEAIARIGKLTQRNG